MRYEWFLSFCKKMMPVFSILLWLTPDDLSLFLSICQNGIQISKGFSVITDSEVDKDSLNEALLQRYGVTRSRQLSSDHLAIAVGQEHYRYDVV